MELAGIILCGGKSSRMGVDKGLLEFKGKPMVGHSIYILNYFTSDIFLSTSNKAYEKFGYPLIPDIHESLGPLGGIFSVMSAVDANKYFVLPGDTPNVTKELTEKLLSNNDKYDIVIPVTSDKKIHPLVGMYSGNIFTKIKNQITSGNYKMQDLLSICNTCYYPVNDSSILKNINTKSDLA